MKGFKLFAIIAAAAILLAPAAAHAGGPRFSFSFNIVDFLTPPPPPPVYVCPLPRPQPIFIERYPVFIERKPVYIERQPVYIETQQRVVREHHNTCQCPDCYAETIKPPYHQGRGH
jgi:hypothetical protein